MTKDLKMTTAHRFLHWGIGLLISVSFLTGFLRETWMSKKRMAAIIQDNWSDITKEEAIKLASSIRAPMWEWHIYAAYLIVGLFLVRVIYMVVKGIKFPNPFSSQSQGKEKLEGIVYIAFYLLITLNVLTGFYHLWGTEPSLRKLSGEIHTWSIYWFPIFILLHLGGIYLAEKSNQKGIASKMIGGD